MNHQKKFAIIMAITFVGALLLASKHRFPELLQKFRPSQVETQRTFSVKKMRVIGAGNFDLVLEDDTRIMATLGLMVVDDPLTTQKLIEFLNHISNPRVTLLKRIPWNPSGQIWTVNFLVSNEGQETNLADWMKLNKLVYQQ